MLAVFWTKITERLFVDPLAQQANPRLSQMPLNDEPTIRLDQFLKAHALVDTGGQAKLLIQDGQVLVNGDIETRRRKQLSAGDIVQLGDATITVEFE